MAKLMMTYVGQEGAAEKHVVVALSDNHAEGLKEHILRNADDVFKVCCYGKGSPVQATIEYIKPMSRRMTLTQHDLTYLDETGLHPYARNLEHSNLWLGLVEQGFRAEPVLVRLQLLDASL